MGKTSGVLFGTRFLAVTCPKLMASVTLRSTCGAMTSIMGEGVFLCEFS